MKKRWISAFGLTVAVVGLVVGMAAAGRSANFTVNWQVVSSGGAPAAGASARLNGSVGQTAIGQSTSANYGLSSGYWLRKGGAAPPRAVRYFPMMLRN